MLGVHDGTVNLMGQVMACVWDTFSTAVHSRWTRIRIDRKVLRFHNVLSFMRAYLSGSIEYAPDLGKGWRARITPFLRALGHEVYDPAADERKNLSDEEMHDFRLWKTADMARYKATLRKRIAWDLDWIESRVDYLVCYWDAAAARGGGTQGELTFAHRAGIPVYLVLGMPSRVVSGWILGCASRLFDNFDDLQSFLTRTYAQRYTVKRRTRGPGHRRAPAAGAGLNEIGN